MGYIKTNGVVDWGQIVNIPNNIAYLPTFEYWQDLSFTTLIGHTEEFSIVINPNEVVSYEFDLLGRKQGTNEIWSAKYVNAVVNNAGILTQIGLSQNFLRENFVNNPSVLANNSGFTHRIFVGSSVMQAINWIGKIRIFKTTLP
jgi:hypothetical protein